jgi:hypothetical protein
MPTTMALLGVSLALLTLVSAVPLISTPSHLENSLEESILEPRATLQYDVVIYGGTLAALSAAVQCVRMNKTVAIVMPDAHLGGMTISGLGWTDSKQGAAIGGIAREFYGRIYKYYNTASRWTQQTRQQYIALNVKAQPGPAIDTAAQVQWTFEPKAARAVIEDWITHGKIPVYANSAVLRDGTGVTKSGATIQSIHTIAGLTFQGSMFIDAGYEGDLVEAAKVSYVVGRDSEAQYGESLAGMKLDNDPTAYSGVDPYVQKGQPGSGLLPGIEQDISPLPANFNGTVDHSRLQAFNYRLTLTKVASNKVPFSKPAGYNVADFELLLRSIEAGKTDTFTTSPMPNQKTDSNSKGHFSLDYDGGSYDIKAGTTYTEASYGERQQYAARHKYYEQGLLWTLVNSTRVPKSIRDAVNAYGLSKDEYVDNGNWPYQLYIREARRMQGLYTVTQQNVQGTSDYGTDSVVGLASYSMDCHTVRRVVVSGHIYEEGLSYTTTSSWQIPYGAIVPQKNEATNLLNPVTVSASHVAFGSLRMEPTYMILGQSAGTAAALALEQKTSVQDIDRIALTNRLVADKQALSV